MITDDYRKYLKSKEWKSIRVEVLHRDRNRCTGCNTYSNNGRGLEIHHLTYKNIFNEDLEDLVTLCTECHKKAHGKHKIDKPTTPKKRTKKQDKIQRKEQQILTLQDLYKKKGISKNKFLSKMKKLKGELFLMKNRGASKRRNNPDKQYRTNNDLYR